MARRRLRRPRSASRAIRSAATSEGGPIARELDLARARQHLCFALDYPTAADALAALALVAPEIGLAKVGLELFVGGGPSVVSAVRESGLDVFLDLKLCDIPATVAGAVRRAVALDVRLLTVHALGGGEMLAAAVAAAADTRTTIVAVTILTSLDAADLDALGITGDTGEAVERLGRLAWRAGVRAFVCSPGELGRLRADLGRDALLITPGIRPADSDATADQKRVATPAASMAAGANLLVVGRPIRDAADPASAARAVVREIAAALERAS